jgi:hypothetical protein
MVRRVIMFGRTTRTTPDLGRPVWTTFAQLLAVATVALAAGAINKPMPGVLWLLLVARVLFMAVERT